MSVVCHNFEQISTYELLNLRALCRGSEILPVPSMGRDGATASTGIIFLQDEGQCKHNNRRYAENPISVDVCQSGRLRLNRGVDASEGLPPGLMETQSGMGQLLNQAIDCTLQLWRPHSRSQPGLVKL